MNSQSNVIDDLMMGLRASEGEDEPAWTFYEGRRCALRLSRRGVADHVERLAGYLVDGLGVRPGERVAVLSTNRVELPVLLLAVMRAGAVAVPLNPHAAPEDWAGIVEHSGARLIFADERASKLRSSPCVEILPLDGLLDRSGSCPDRGASGADAGVVLYTSGTTGTPKGVVLGVRSLIANARRMATLFGLDQTTQLAVLPLFHAHAFGFGLMTSLVSRGHLVVADGFDPFSFAHLIREEKVRVTSLVPTLLAPLLDVGLRRHAVPSLEKLLVSSAPLDVAIAQSFEDRTGLPIVHGWGLSEYTNFACCVPPNLTDDARRSLLYGGEIASMGCPLPGTEVTVLDAHGGPAAECEPGELCVRGDGRMLSYFRDPEATRRTIDSDGWLHTGDEGVYRLFCGRPFFFVTGRIKEIIIRGAEKVSPLAIERRLLSGLPELGGKLVVLGFPHTVHGEEVGAYLEIDSVPKALELRLLEALAGMHRDSRPKVVLFGPMRIPRTHTGKVQRRRLEQLFSSYRSWHGRSLVRAAALETA